MYILDTDRMAELMKEAGISQKDLAEKTHITPCAISCYLSGKRTPRLNQFFKICEALDCTVIDLIVRL